MEYFTQFFHSGLSFIVILSVIVFIHEFGHYYIAKLCGVKIEVFSIGFGKELFGWDDKSGTRWKVSLLPFGGYVKMFGDVNPASIPDNEKIAGFTSEEQKIAFHTKPLYMKSAIVAFGPIANFLLAIVIIAGMFTYDGKPNVVPVVGRVLENSAAAQAGLTIGDTILSMDNEKIGSFNDIQRIIAINTGTSIETTFLRNGQEQTVSITPIITSRKDMFGNDIKAAMLGISSNTIFYEKLNILQALGAATVETYNISTSTLKAIGQMITGERSVKEISGPIGIAKYSGQSAEQGWRTVLWFMAVLSINLGLVNFFPIPVLDGGHLLYYAVEAVRGKPLADKVQQWGFKIGIALVVTLAIFAIFNDIRNLF
ncbi:MAG: Zinc metalloprotease [Rickettsiaceae bacterium]|jgi:regulator of sigma E protease|nr:Zinc metalloprotease [Rickettsiaceae bacterium]